MTARYKDGGEEPPFAGLAPNSSSSRAAWLRGSARLHAASWAELRRTTAAGSGRLRACVHLLRVREAEAEERGDSEVERWRRRAAVCRPRSSSSSSGAAWLRGSGSASASRTISPKPAPPARRRRPTLTGGSSRSVAPLLGSVGPPVELPRASSCTRAQRGRRPGVG